MISNSGGFLPPQDDPNRTMPGLRAKLWRAFGRRFQKPAWFFRGWRQQSFYLGAGGADSNDGLTWKTRKLTIDGAEQAALYPGDTIYVGPS